MQTSLTNQKNQEASLRNLETQVGQLAKQLANQQGGQFSTNTQPNPKEQCKAITIRCGKQVGSDINKETVKSKQSAVRNGEDRVEEESQPELATEEESTEVRTQDEKKYDKS